MSAEHPVLGIFGGSGLYDLPTLTEQEEHQVYTPFGRPSAPVLVGTLNGLRVAFMARHGLGHSILPSEVNYRANIYAMKSFGVKWLVSVNTCGSLREDYAPDHIVIPDQLIDITKGRENTFFGEGLVAHVSMAEPFCSDLSQKAAAAVSASDIPLHTGGTLLTLEGPRYSTRAEANLYRTWGVSLVGMSTATEAFLAREAELCYTVLARVSNYDVWQLHEDLTELEQSVTALNQHSQPVIEALGHLAASLNPEQSCKHQQALKHALTTTPAKIPAATRQKLGLLINKYYKDSDSA